MKEEWRRKLYVHCSNMNEKNVILLLRLEILKLIEIRRCVGKWDALCLKKSVFGFIYIYVSIQRNTKVKGRVFFNESG
jgi:hypothetical protein